MKQFVHWWRVQGRIRHLEYMINRIGQSQMSWGYELAYIRRTGKLDWVDPNPMRVMPAGSKPKPVPRG